MHKGRRRSITALPGVSGVPQVAAINYGAVDVRPCTGKTDGHLYVKDTGTSRTVSYWRNNTHQWVDLIGPMDNDGKITDGSALTGDISVGAITCTSLNATSGAITGGAITGAALVCTSLNAGSGTITTSGAITGAAVTCTTIDCQGNNITDVGEIALDSINDHGTDVTINTRLLSGTTQDIGTEAAPFGNMFMASAVIGAVIGMDEVSVPGTPPTGRLYIYAVDNSGTTELWVKMPDTSTHKLATE